MAVVGYRTVGQFARAYARRYEADVRFEKSGFLLQAEYIGASDKKKSDTEAKDGYGTYVALAYTHPLGIQVAGRFSFLDPNKASDVKADQMAVYEAGVTYFVKGNDAKLELAYSRSDYDQKAAKPKADENQVILMAQVSY